jgi:hypothetical protein
MEDRAAVMAAVVVEAAAVALLAKATRAKVAISALLGPPGPPSATVGI